LTPTNYQIECGKKNILNSARIQQRQKLFEKRNLKKSKPDLFRLAGLEPQQSIRQFDYSLNSFNNE